MAKQTIATIAAPATLGAFRTAVNGENAKGESNFVELYAADALLSPKFHIETVAGSTQQITLAQLSRAYLTNNLQTVSANAAITLAAPVVAGMEWDMLVAVTLDAGVTWSLTLPTGASFLYEGTMGSNGGTATFTAPARGTTANFKVLTIGTGVVVIVESNASTLTVS